MLCCCRFLVAFSSLTLFARPSQSKGKYLLKKLWEVVKSHGLTIEDWFNSMDTTFQRDQMLEETDSEDEEENENGQDADAAGQRTLQKEVVALQEDEEEGTGPKRRPTWFVKKQKVLASGKQERPTGALSTNELRIGFKKMAKR